MNHRQVVKALKVLAPNAQYVIRDDVLEWHSTDIPMPSESEIEAEIENQKLLEYREQRAKEYPSIGDQLDALFHAGVFPPEMEAQIQAIKDKYPKPSGV